MARIGTVTELSSLIARPPGHSCLIKWNSFVVSGGADGMIAIYQVTDNTLKVVAQKRIHKGAVTCIAAWGENIFSCGDESVIFAIRLVKDVLESTLIYRSTLPLRAICVLNGDYLVAFGDELKLLLIEHKSFVVKYSLGPLSSTIDSMAVVRENRFISVSSNGLISEYAIQNDIIEEVENLNLHVFLEHSTIHKINDGRLAICDPKNGVLIMQHSPKLALIDHVRQLGALQFSMEILNKDYALILHSMGLELFDLESNQVAVETKVPCTQVYRMILFEEHKFVFVDVEGNLALYSIPVEYPPQESRDIGEKPTKKRKNILSLFDSDDEGTVQKLANVKPTKNLRKKSSKRNKFIEDDAKEDKNEDSDEIDQEDFQESEEEEEAEISESERNSGEEILHDFDVEQEDEESSHELVSVEREENVGSMFKSMYSPFQPSSTPIIDGYQILCWNNVGVINNRHDSGYQSIEIEFHDKNFHRSIRFIDEVGFRMASLGRGGALFGAPKREGVKAQINGVPLDGIDRSNPWIVDLDDNEDVLGLTVGGAGGLASPFIGVVVTSFGFVRTFSMQGLQGMITLIPGNFVSMAANNAFLIVLYTLNLNDLHFAIYSLSNMCSIASGPLGGRFNKIKVTWLGLLEDSSQVAAVYDEEGCLSILQSQSNSYTWQPWLIRPHLWPILFSRKEMLAVVLKEDAEYPEVIPRPIPTSIPLEIPFVGEDREAIDLIHQANQISPHGEMTEKEYKKMQISADKHTLELFQQSIRTDRLSKAAELCKWLLNEKSWGMAVQLAKHNRMMQLADCIESMKDEMEALKREERSPVEQVKIEPKVTVITPRNMIRLVRHQSETPTTLLANLTPLPLKDEKEKVFLESHHDHFGLAEESAGKELPFSTLSMTPAKREDTTEKSTLSSILKNISKSSTTFM